VKTRGTTAVGDAEADAGDADVVAEATEEEDEEEATGDDVEGDGDGVVAAEASATLPSAGTMSQASHTPRIPQNAFQVVESCFCVTFAKGQREYS
jgi:hypothetical protein